jgi:hypothetical protein
MVETAKFQIPIVEKDKSTFTFPVKRNQSLLSSLQNEREPYELRIVSQVEISEFNLVFV